VETAAPDAFARQCRQEGLSTPRSAMTQTWALMERPTRMSREPRRHLRVRVGGIVIDHRFDHSGCMALA
jgi:hypothetical protein